MNVLVPVPDLLEPAAAPAPAPSTCRQCGQGFTPRKGGRLQAFCSAACRRTFHDSPEQIAARALNRGQRDTLQTEDSGEGLLNPPAATGAFIDHRPNGGPLLIVPESDLKHADRLFDPSPQFVKEAVERMAEAGATATQLAGFAATCVEAKAEAIEEQSEPFCGIIPRQAEITVEEMRDGNIRIEQEDERGGDNTIVVLSRMNAVQFARMVLWAAGFKHVVIATRAQGGFVDLEDGDLPETSV